MEKELKNYLAIGRYLSLEKVPSARLWWQLSSNSDQMGTYRCDLEIIEKLQNFL